MKKLSSSSLVPQKGGQKRVLLDAAPDRALKIRTVRPKAGRLVTLNSNVIPPTTKMLLSLQTIIRSTSGYNLKCSIHSANVRFFVEVTHGSCTIFKAKFKTF
jgi:hypothetical protein